MKQLHYIILTLVAAVLLGGGCTDAGTDNGKTTTPPSFEVSLKSAGVTSAEIAVKSHRVTEYAYIISDDQNAPSSVEIFTEGVTTKLETESSEENITIDGFEGSSTHYIHFAHKTDESKFGEEKTIECTTEAYTETITVVKTTIDAITVHVEVPADTYYKIGLADLFDFIERQEMFGTSELDYLESIPNSNKGPKTFTFKNGDVMFPDTPGLEDMKYIIAPGSMNHIMMSECDQDGQLMVEIDWDMGQVNWTGIYNFMNVGTKAPDASQYKLNLNIEALTSRSVTFSVNPEAGLEGYTYYIGTKEQTDKYVNDVTEQGFITTVATKMAPEEGPKNFIFRDFLEEGESYVIYVVGYESYEALNPIVVEKKEFVQKNSTKPAPKLEVKAISAPDGKDSPYMIWFNVKAPNKDLTRAKYLCNTIGQWNAQLSKEGVTYESMLLSAPSQTNELTADKVAQINSAAGYDMSFQSEEMKSFRLAILGYNNEEVIAAAHADTKSLEVPAEPRVESTLFTELAGTWTATITNNANKKEVTFPVVIGSSAQKGPATCPEEVYALYPTLTRAEVDALFADFKAYEQKFEEKYRGRNQLLCSGYNNAVYKTPWELFIHTKYSCYENSDIFFDYGPKWFLHIGEGDVVTAPVDMRLPLANWDGRTYYLLGGAAGTSPLLTLDKAFNVTVSEDKQTLTVHSYEHEGNTYYPTMVYLQSGFTMTSLLGKSDLVLKKTTDAPTSLKQNNNYAETAGQPAIMNINAANTYKMTKLGLVSREVKEAILFSSKEAVEARLAKQPNIKKVR